MDFKINQSELSEKVLIKGLFKLSEKESKNNKEETRETLCVNLGVSD